MSTHTNQIENISGQNLKSSLDINNNNNHQDNDLSGYKHFMDPVTEIGTRQIPHSCDELRIALNNDDLNDETSVQVDDELQSEMFTNSTVQVRKDIEQEPYHKSNTSSNRQANTTASHLLLPNAVSYINDTSSLPQLQAYRHKLITLLKGKMDNISC